MGTKKKKATRRRRGFPFWLNMKNEYDRFIADLITDFKTEREFTRTVRQGLHLIWDLRHGRVDMLLTLFPNIAELLELKLTPPTPPQDTSALVAQVARLEQAFLAAGQGGLGDRLPTRALPERPTTSSVAIAPEDMSNSSENFLEAFM